MDHAPGANFAAMLQRPMGSDLHTEAWGLARSARQSLDRTLMAFSIE